MIAHNVAAIAELTERIKALDASISRLAVERYPETIYLQQVSGVGPITSLYFVLKVGNPGRFQQTRDIGAFLGLCPKRDQSGETDKDYAFPNAETDICDVCWLAPRSIFWDPSGPTVPCASTDYVSPRREQPRPRSGPSSPSHESSPYCSSRSGNPVNLMNPSPLWPEPY